jgi:hypothetical protein
MVFTKGSLAGLLYGQQVNFVFNVLGFDMLTEEQQQKVLIKVLTRSEPITLLMAEVRQESIRGTFWGEDCEKGVLEQFRRGKVPFVLSAAFSMTRMFSDQSASSDPNDILNPVMVTSKVR